MIFEVVWILFLMSGIITAMGLVICACERRFSIIPIITGVVLILITSVMSAHNNAEKDMEYITAKILNIDGAQYVKIGDDFININERFGKVFKEEEIELCRVDRNKKYYGIYPDKFFCRWRLK